MAKVILMIIFFRERQHVYWGLCGGIEGEGERNPKQAPEGGA